MARDADAVQKRHRLPTPRKGRSLGAGRGSRPSRRGKVLVPEQLNLLWKLGVRRATDCPQLASVPLIESAGPHVDILGFDLELPTTVQLRPDFDPFEQRRTNALAS